MNHARIFVCDSYMIVQYGRGMGPDPGPGPQLIFAGGPTIYSYATAFTKWSKKTYLLLCLCPCFLSLYFSGFCFLTLWWGPLFGGGPCARAHVAHALTLSMVLNWFVNTSFLLCFIITLYFRHFIFMLIGHFNMVYYPNV